MTKPANIADLVWLESEIDEELIHLLSKPVDGTKIAKLEHCQSDLQDEIAWLCHCAPAQQVAECKPAPNASP